MSKSDSAIAIVCFAAVGYAIGAHTSTSVPAPLAVADPPESVAGGGAALGALSFDAAPPPEEIAWLTWEAADALAGDRPRLVLLSLPDCGPCRALKLGPLADARVVAAVNAGFVAVESTPSRFALREAPQLVIIPPGTPAGAAIRPIQPPTDAAGWLTLLEANR